MSAPTDTSVNGKAPAQPAGSGSRANHQRGLVNVQPARLSDLQPKYAQQINHGGDESVAHGWYASFSKYPGRLSQSTCPNPVIDSAWHG